MIADLKPYPEYKESGLPWLGQVPANWTTPRTKTRFRLSIEKSGKAHGKELLSIYTHIGVRPRKDLEQRGNKATSIDGYWVVRKGDIIVNKLLAWMGAVGVSHFDGVTSPAYDVLRPTQRLESDYYHHLFRTKLYLALFKAQSRGIMDMRLRLYFDELGQIPLLCPPPAEQAAIVRFLHWATGRLERAIGAKRKVIALLNEQKQAIIHRAVTRGLDPCAPLKPSGIPWLGDIPKHWEVRKIRAVSARITKGTTPTTLGKEFVDTGIRFLKVESISKDLTILPNKCAFIDVTTDRLLSRSRLRAGDVVVAIAGAIGRPAVIQESLIPANTNQAVAIISPLNGQCLSEWLAYNLSSPMCLRAMTDSSVQSAQANLSLASLGRTVIPLPPVREQGDILSGLVVAIDALATTMSRLEREIALLREYRTRLVADVVTGKLDVREAAARLPDEPGKAELLDDEATDARDTGDEAEEAMTPDAGD